MQQFNRLPANIARFVATESARSSARSLPSFRSIAVSRLICASHPSSVRRYATFDSSPPQQPTPLTVVESASQLAAHLAEHPEKLDYMIKVVSQQLGSIRKEIEQKDEHFEAAEAAAVLGALRNTIDTLLPAVTDKAKKNQLDNLMGDINQLRTSL